MDVKIAGKDGRPSRMSALRLSRREKESAEASAEQVIVEMSPADRLKGLTASEIKSALSTKQVAGLKRSLLDDAERTPAWNQGHAVAMTRVMAVLRSDEYRGREAAAADLLGNDKLAASDIIGLLARMPGPPDPVDLQEAAEEAARAEMRAELAKNRNSSIDLTGPDMHQGGAQRAEKAWDSAIAKTFSGASPAK